MLVSIITPWQNHPELIPDYENAVRGAQVIIIDNASTPDATAALRAMTERLHGLYLRNEINAGFSGANNQGLARATGEIILFLNNDIAAGPTFLDDVRRDTVEGCLFGPLLMTQVVYGVTLPYLEGWCLAGRRSAWQKVGGWDAEAYPQPYWEDNDLCLRAWKLACDSSRPSGPSRTSKDKQHGNWFSGVRSMSVTARSSPREYGRSMNGFARTSKRAEICRVRKPSSPVADALGPPWNFGAPFDLQSDISSPILLL